MMSIDYSQQIEMTAKHGSVNNVFWRVVAGRTGLEGVAGKLHPYPAGDAGDTSPSILVGGHQREYPPNIITYFQI